jgi:hypothetical protein
VAAVARAVVLGGKIEKREAARVEFVVRQRWRRDQTGGKTTRQEQAATGLLLSPLTNQMSR